MAIADESVANMDNVMAGAMEATGKMGQIAKQLAESVGDMREINGSIGEVSVVIDSNAASSEETAAVSEEQKAQ